jgi:hypothetical protein
MIHLLTYEYEGSAVPFTDDAYVNLTTLCAKFGKRPSKFLELPATRDFIAALAADTGLAAEKVMSVFRTSLWPADALLVTIRGNHADGREQGTWAHPDLAVECARWLSPAFAIWCNRVVRCILSGRPYHTAGDRPLHKALERGIEQTRETLQRKHDAYWHALEVEGNVSIKAYLLAAGIEMTTKERMVLGARVAYRSKLAGSPVGKVRQRRNRAAQRCSPGNVHYGWHKVATYSPEHLHAEIEGLGFPHAMPGAEALAAAWEQYLPGPPKLGRSLYNGRGEALAPVQDTLQLN